jgi:hypothetical protein
LATSGLISISLSHCLDSVLAFVRPSFLHCSVTSNPVHTRCAPSVNSSVVPPTHPYIPFGGGRGTLQHGDVPGGGRRIDVEREKGEKKLDDWSSAGYAGRNGSRKGMEGRRREAMPCASSRDEHEARRAS